MGRNLTKLINQLKFINRKLKIRKKRRTKRRRERKGEAQEKKTEIIHEMGLVLVIINNNN